MEIQVVNIKCGGCANGIKSRLTGAGFRSIDVDVENQKVSFQGDTEKAKRILSSMGYPEAGSKEAEKVLKKAKSFVSCAIGRLK